MAAFIDENMNDPQINTLVFTSSMANFEEPVVIPNFFCKHGKTLVKYWWFEILLLWNAVLVFTARSGFPEQVEFGDSSLSLLSVFLSLHFRIFDWILAWIGPHRFPGAIPTASFIIDPELTGSLKSCGGFFLALNGLCNTRFIGFDFAIAEFIGFGFAIGEPSLDVASCPLFDIALLPDRIRKKNSESGCKRTSRNSWCWTNEEDDSTRHAKNSLGLACQRVGFWCQHIWFGSWVPRSILSNNQSSATPWALDECLSWWQLRCF